MHSYEYHNCDVETSVLQSKPSTYGTVLFMIHQIPYNNSVKKFFFKM